MTEEDFVGTWRLVSMKARSSDGNVTYPLGESAGGLIMYSRDGFMSVVLFSADRARFGTPDILAGSEKQLAAAARSYISYAGRYRIQGDRVIHLVQSSLFPDWLGSTQERRYEFKGRRLTLSTDPMLLKGRQSTVELVWERGL
jgi:Lipocalin-like domain